MILALALADAAARPGTRRTLGPTRPMAVTAVAPARPSFVVGEPLWLDVTFTNLGKEVNGLRLVDSVDNRSYPGEIEVTDPQGIPAPDAWHRPRRGMMGGNGGIGVAAGGSVTVPFDLARYAWLAPGAWTVRLRSGADDAWVSTRVELIAVTPERAREIVEDRPSSIEEQRGRGGPVDYYESLGHPVYVPILEALAAADLGSPTSERPRAVAGLAACPCAEATDALIRIYDQTTDLRRRAIVADELLWRGPAPLPGVERTQWFTDHAWDPRFAEPLLIRARRALEVPTYVPGWDEGYSFGTQIVRQVGGVDDVPWLVAALARTLAAEPSPSALDYLTQRLAGTLERMPRDTLVSQATDADTRRVVDLLAWHGGTDPPPPDWEATLLRALESGRPRVQSLAMQRMLRPPTPALLAAMDPLVESHDRMVSSRASALVGRRPGR